MYGRKSIPAILMAGAVFVPAPFAGERPDMSVESGVSAPLMAAAAGAFDTRELDKIKDSVLRVGVELEGGLSIPESYYDDTTGTFEPTMDPSGEDEGGYLTAYRVGSAFVVDPAGYLVTNAHVVDTSFDAVTDDLWAQFVDDIYASIAEYSPSMSEAEVDTLATAYLTYVAEHGSWGDVEYDIVVFDPSETDAVGDIDELFEEGWSVEVKKMGQPFPEIGKDIAVIKIQGDKEFVPLTFGQSASLGSGSKVYVIGFPTIADLGDKSFLVPSVTSGIVSAMKSSDLGNYDVIQVDASIAGGNSGGPVVDERGRVVGIATFGATEGAGYNWALPIELATEYLKELNVIPVTASTGTFGDIPPWTVYALIGLLTAGLTQFLIRKGVIPLGRQPVMPLPIPLASSQTLSSIPPIPPSIPK